MIKYKNIKFFFFSGLLLLMSCKDYLKSDQFFKDRMTEEKVFTDIEYIEEWLAHTYSYLGGENADVANRGDTEHNFSDDMFYGGRDARYDINWANSMSYNRFMTGQYDENAKQASWTQSYRGIRSASEFIQNIDRNNELSEEERADYKAQARFVRAYYYWLLLRKYGPIPILPDEGIDYTESYDGVATPRSTYEECADYISNEMILAAKDLPLTRGQQSIARPTRGAALATRAKALLYAASPLMNGGLKTDDYAQKLVDDQGRPLLSLDYNEEKWAKAAAAAKDVIELGVYRLYTASFRASGTSAFPATISPPYNTEYSDKSWPDGWADIDPFESYRAVFNGTLSGSENPELIFTRGKNQGGYSIRDMVATQLPREATGWNNNGLTQKQVDAYYMEDGLDVPGKDKEIGRGDGSDRLTGFTTQEDIDAGKYKPLPSGVSLQYANREPRFYASVAYNGSIWHMTNESEERNQEQQVFYYRSEQSGYTNTSFWIRTGIGIKKFVHPRDTYEQGDLDNIVSKEEPAIRYADILLIYAEALNEIDGSYNIPSWDESQVHNINRNVDEIKKGIRPIRIRAGLPDYLSEVYSNKSELRNKIKRERQIELMGEGQRYYDLRRWGDASVELSLPIYGCNVLMTSEQRELFHTPVPDFDLQSAFSSKMYFWPISHRELKRNSRLTQNPGWTYND